MLTADEAKSFATDVAAMLTDEIAAIQIGQEETRSITMEFDIGNELANELGVGRELTITIKLLRKV